MFSLLEASSAGVTTPDVQKKPLQWTGSGYSDHWLNIMFLVGSVALDRFYLVSERAKMALLKVKVACPCGNTTNQG